ncbi:caspase family protein [Streptomyces sp. TBY4]|uniref:caspase family protein n=1 Tax=Streptomyces sp. TBY4 TaxID=2962030 RepID=UPI0020B6D8AB|nr:caspase family protein [Streptomyces sp. TBY4]MCP3756392.1 caspase family protein [Streptomyces sp. TBY4]
MGERRGRRIRGTVLGVVVENYQSDRFPTLEGATAQMENLCELLEPFGYRKKVLRSPTRDELRQALASWSLQWAATGNHGPAVVLWSGHAVLQSRELRLIVYDTQDVADLEETYSPGFLTSTVLRTGADQVLMLIDTCYAGAGVPDVMNRWLYKLNEDSLPPGRSAWIGAIACCHPEKTAEDSGILLDTATRLLGKGPRAGKYQHAFSARNRHITGQNLLEGIKEQWPQDTGQVARVNTAGFPQAMFANPRRPTAAHAEPQLVEHLVRAARGADRVDEGWFFSGRHRLLGEITQWLERRKPGLFLVTGSAGSGKSAVLGRIWTLSEPKHRADILAHRALVRGDPDPGPDSVDASFHLRGLTVQQLARAIARALKLPPPLTPAALIADVESGWPGPDHPLVLLLDGLDEAAPDQIPRIVKELLAPLSRLACVVLGSRDRPFSHRAEPGEALDRTVSRLLNTRAHASVLDEEADTADDITRYSRQRLIAAGLPEEDASTAAQVIAVRACAGGGGGFLFASMAVRSVIRRVGGSLREDWNQVIPESIGAAFADDVRSGPKRERDGTPLPYAAEDLLTALAWSSGNGMPAQGVWEAAATSLSVEGVRYDPADVDWLLNAYGRYVVEDGDGAQAVYRLYHHELVNHLRRVSESYLPEDPPYRVARALVDLLRAQTADAARIGSANPYLRRTLAEHVVMAGVKGIELVRELFDLDPDLFLSDLAESLSEVAFAQSADRPDQAVPLAREGAALFRILAKRDPDTYVPYHAQSLMLLGHLQAESGNAEAALTSVTKAIGLFRTLAARNPAARRPDLALCLNALTDVHARHGDRHGALKAMTEASTLYRLVARENPAAYLPDLARTLLDLSVLQNGVGDRARALASVCEAVGIYRALAQDNPTTHFGNLSDALELLSGLVSARQAVTVHTELERALAEHPDVVRRLALRRAELLLAFLDRDLGIRVLVALADPPGRPEVADTAVQARRLLRAQRRTDEASAVQVDAVWRAVAGTDPPDWLGIPDAAVDLAAGWVACPTWAEARTFWEEHAELLCSAEVTTALEEIALVDRSATARLHRPAAALLRVARESASRDPDTAFFPYLTRECVETWKALPTWEESHNYLAAHAEFLLSDRAVDLLESDLKGRRQAEHFALAVLARADGIDAAYQYVMDRGALRSRCQRLLATPEEPAPVILLAIGFLEFTVHREAFTGQAHGRLALALANGRLLDDPWHPHEVTERERAIEEIRSVNERHPGHGEVLCTLIRSIRAASGPRPL